MLPAGIRPLEVTAGASFALADTTKAHRDVDGKWQGPMRVKMPTGDDSDPMDCPHQFVGRCDACSAPVRQGESADSRDRRAS
jgi:hypothetical protein